MMREATNIAMLPASAVVKKLIARPQKPSSSTGRRPKRSDSAPRMGADMNCDSAYTAAITPYQRACSEGSAVNWPTMAGSTGTMMPTASMSISTTSMMKRIAAPWAAAVCGEAGFTG